MPEKEIIKAALAWRKDWADMKDTMEMESGCDCEVCNLIRACDAYAEDVEP